ncbi:MAG: hypothetical protein QNJ34_21440 [Xenococcaceae cyanobacterium MO_188.B29]|nr:hypothetical protein [Xenococcaceae cyanobacterium MO_188.B29]
MLSLEGYAPFSQINTLRTEIHDEFTQIRDRLNYHFLLYERSRIWQF